MWAFVSFGHCFVVKAAMWSEFPCVNVGGYRNKQLFLSPVFPPILIYCFDISMDGVFQTTPHANHLLMSWGEIARIENMFRLCKHFVLVQCLAFPTSCAPITEALYTNISHPQMWSFFPPSLNLAFRRVTMQGAIRNNVLISFYWCFIINLVLIPSYFEDYDVTKVWLRPSAQNVSNRALNWKHLPSPSELHRSYIKIAHTHHCEGLDSLVHVIACH